MNSPRDGYIRSRVSVISVLDPTELNDSRRSTGEERDTFNGGKESSERNRISGYVAGPLLCPRYLDSEDWLKLFVFWVIFPINV